MKPWSKSVLAIVALCFASGAAAQEHEIREMFAEYVGTPTSWSDAMASASVVAHVRLLDVQYRTVSGGLLVITQYTAEVLEDFKAGIAVTRTVQVYRLGGIRREGNRTIKYSVRGYPDFVVGEEYVLFLDWNSAVGAYATKGPEFVYGLDAEAGRVRSSGTSPFAVRQRDRTISSLFAHLRTAR